MNQQQQQHLVQDFIQVTNQSKESALFHLEASNWNLESALASFYENESDSVPSTSSLPSAQRSTHSSQPPSSSSAPSSVGSSRASKFATLSQLSNPKSDGDKNTYFAGGKNSGVAIQGPDDATSKSSPLAIVGEILNQAQANSPRPPPQHALGMGSEKHPPIEFEEEEEEDVEENEQSPKKPTYFTGSGYRLGSDASQPSQLTIKSSTTDDSASSKTKKVIRTLTFWKNGFSIEDGPLFTYDVPENQAILNAIKSGRAPVGVLNVLHGQAVDLRVAQKMDQDFVAPPPKPFSGSGHRLGSVIPASVQGSPSPPPTASGSSTQATPTQWMVDPNLPITNLQIRLIDGTRLVAKFNHHHTLRDVYAFVAHSRPQSRPYVLQTTFPLKVLEADERTLNEAGLLNCALIQKYL